ncbi:MAG: VOC family protein [Proteobacteria bacterium]|nr:VOC family protein [Pseudomonadota bacterium]
MLHHVSVGASDIGRATKFYDAALAPLGMERVMEFGAHKSGNAAVAYGAKGRAEFWVQLPHDGQPASSGNGVHICFTAPSIEAVQAFHEAGLKAGGADDGAPGPRSQYSPDYYGAFLRDPDGNKIEAVRFGT